jgi:hypothetical protein
MNSRFDNKIEIVEKNIKRYAEWRRKKIYDSLIRPLYQEILKCIFIIIIMIFDTFILLEIIILINPPINIILFLFCALILFYIEIKIYNYIWGRKGKWSINKYKKKREMKFF